MKKRGNIIKKTRMTKSLRSEALCNYKKDIRKMKVQKQKEQKERYHKSQAVNLNKVS